MTRPLPPAAPISMDAEGQRLLQRLADLVPLRQPAVLVTVWGVEGSAPRGPGARMLCRGGRLLAGTIGGGHLEDQALRDAVELEAGPAAAADSHAEVGDADAPPSEATLVEESAGARGGVARVIRYPLGPQLAQCCGGVVRLHFQPVDAAAAGRLQTEFETAVQTGATLRTGFADESLYEQPQAVPTVLLCGAGHVATALARVLQPLPWRVIVVDARPEWADRARFAPAVEVIATEPLRLLAAWGWLGPAAAASHAAQRLLDGSRPVPAAPWAAATRAIVMTHDHALDRELVDALLRVPDRIEAPRAALPYVGLIGSPSKAAATRHRLRQGGLAAAVIDRLVSPIGLRLGSAADAPLLGGKLPGEIAIGVAAQLLALPGPPTP